MNNVLANGAIADFPATDNNSTLFKLKKKKKKHEEQKEMAQKMLKLDYH